jgi:hypothetical protein
VEGCPVARHRFGRRRVKPLALMRAIAADYTREGDLVCDPTCGAGTTLRAAIELGRRAVGGDALEAHAHLAAAWLAEPVQQRLAVLPEPEQLELGGAPTETRSVTATRSMAGNGRLGAGLDSVRT